MFFREKFSVAQSLKESLQQFEIELTDEERDQVERYCQLLWEWNEKLNLTRHLDYETFVARDVVDAMQLAECLEDGERVLDIGSGGGVPGILLAILRPKVLVTVCDSIEKKTKALEDIIKKLKLPTRTVTSRVQDLFPSRRFNTLVARAVGPTHKILRWVQPHWKSFDRLLLIKGPRWIEERKEARHYGLLADLELRKVKSYPMPGTESESVILSLQPAEPSSS